MEKGGQKEGLFAQPIDGKRRGRAQRRRERLYALSPRHPRYRGFDIGLRTNHIVHGDMKRPPEMRLLHAYRSLFPASRTHTLRPSSAARFAADRPARSAPTIRTSAIIGASRCPCSDATKGGPRANLPMPRPVAIFRPLS